MYAYKNSAKPSNVGTGIYFKQVEANLKKINTANKVVDDVFTGIAYAGVAIEVEIGIYNNAKSGKSLQKIAWDATVDTAVLGVNTYLSVSVGAAVTSAIAGATVGSAFPIVGTIVGAGVGFVFGLALDHLSRDFRNNMKSLVH